MGQKYTRVGRFPPEQVLPFAGKGKKKYKGTDGKTYNVNMDSMRYYTFRRSRRCVCCGLYGTVMFLEFNSHTAKQPHFNLYGIVDGKYVLMTKDHKVPRSKGGPEKMSNMQTMCTHCNARKRNNEWTLEELRSHLTQWIAQVKRERNARRRRVKKKGVQPHAPTLVHCHVPNPLPPIAEVEQKQADACGPSAPGLQGDRPMERPAQKGACLVRIGQALARIYQWAFQRTR